MDPSMKVGHGDTPSNCPYPNPDPSEWRRSPHYLLESGGIIPKARYTSWKKGKCLYYGLSYVRTPSHCGRRREGGRRRGWSSGLNKGWVWTESPVEEGGW